MSDNFSNAIDDDVSNEIQFIDDIELQSLPPKKEFCDEEVII